MRRLLWRTSVVLATSGLLAFAWNALSGRGLALDRNVLIKAEDEVVDLAQARRRMEQGALVLDARPVDFYRMSHVPGALPLPSEDFERAFATLEPRLRSALDVVVYCSGFGCEASHEVARKLKSRGVPAAILADGMPAWEDAKLPLEQGDAR